MLPAQVQRLFPLVLTSGCAVHRSVFDDLVNKITHGSSAPSVQAERVQRHHAPYHNAAEQYIDYLARQQSILTLPGMMSAPAATPVASGTGQEQQDTAAATPPQAAAEAAGTVGATTTAPLQQQGGKQQKAAGQQKIQGFTRTKPKKSKTDAVSSAVAATDAAIGLQ